LLGALFESVAQDQPLTVLDTGPAVQETVDFLSRYRCRLHIVDLFSDLPIEVDEGGSGALHRRFDELLPLPEGTVFDICLFWDLFNYLSRDAILAFVAALRPYLRKGALAYGFGMHKPSAPRDERVYGIGDIDRLAVRPRSQPLPGYAPHAQGKLKNMLYCFQFERSVLLSDGRLEMLLRAKG
jgi:hypothetical protein